MSPEAGGQPDLTQRVADAIATHIEIVLTPRARRADAVAFALARALFLAGLVTGALGAPEPVSFSLMILPVPVVLLEAMRVKEPFELRLPSSLAAHVNLPRDVVVGDIPPSLLVRLGEIARDGRSHRPTTLRERARAAPFN